MKFLPLFSRNLTPLRVLAKSSPLLVRRTVVTTARQYQIHHSSQHNQYEEKFLETKADKVLVRVLEQGKTLPHQQWIIRLNVLNGYLSWCRNSYLCLAGFITLTISTYGMIDMPQFMNVLPGLEVAAQGLSITKSHFCAIRIDKMSTLTVLFYMIAAVLHLFIFYSVFKVLFTLEEELESEDDKKS